MRILAIESSCDDTAAAVLEGPWEIQSSVSRGQADLHAPFGGVVPELAGRCHTERITQVIEEALHSAGTSPQRLEGIAVTNRPGLIGSLLIGVTAAQALGLALDIPVAGVHHIEGHVFSGFLAAGGFRLPAVCLVASGGHTELFHVRGPHDYALLGRRLDDAAGEALDKAARVLGLGNGGGAALDRLAAGGDAGRAPFPVPRTEGPLDFSFSGLKTALIQRRRRIPGESPADVAAGYLRAVVECLVQRGLAAVEAAGVETLCLGGGVSANSMLRSRLAEECRSRGVELLIPPLALCTDNAAMIAAVGHSLLLRGRDERFEIEARARSPLVEA